MHELGDVQLGFAGKPEIAAFLNLLLEAERAGAAVARRSAASAGTLSLGPLLKDVHRDELRWCRMLTRNLRSLGELPSKTVGSFYGKAMAIDALSERMKFLNRGQGWVVRKLSEMLPRIRDPKLHADLVEMLRAHELNIELVDKALV
jgi:nitronate monooxygenase